MPYLTREEFDIAYNYIDEIVSRCSGVEFERGNYLPKWYDETGLTEDECLEKEVWSNYTTRIRDRNECNEDFTKDLNKELKVIEEEGYFCIEDIKSWCNPYRKKNPRSMSGETAYKILNAYTQYYNVEIQFTCKGDAGQRILELLNIH